MTRTSEWGRQLAVSAVTAALALTSPAVLAHIFVQPYSLPIPFWMYAWGATAALLLSFVTIAVFASAASRRRGAVDARAAEPTEPVEPPVPGILTTGRVIAASLLAICIVSGVTGRSNPFENFNMTFFWIVFVLGVPYLTAFIGDFYARLNPWETIVICVERLIGRPFLDRPAIAAPAGHWPAVLLFVIFIQIELFGRLFPRGLSVALAIYSVVNVLGAWAMGRHAWFSQGEFFAVMFRLIGRMAPLAYSRRGAVVRAPFKGLLAERPKDLGLVAFILFMLSSTAFDGFHGTRPWVEFYWQHLNPLLTESLDLAPRARNAWAAYFYQVWQIVMLTVSPVVYFAVYLAVMACMGAIYREVGVRRLVLEFATSLIPIAFVYHVTHYFALLFAQGGQIVRLASDPLGLNWNLLGTATWTVPPVMVDMDVLWHTQVALIVVGHVVSVWVAHEQAHRLYGSQRRAIVSQLPMLLLMMAFTAFGLWILSLPLDSGR